ncbi:MAG: SRPBCC family protein [Planctomycetota bacterium]|jgi:choline monooxygenase
MDMDSMRFVARRVFELDCNWKVFVDNYLDGGYHVPHMHPGLNANLEFAAYETRLGDIYSMQTCPAKGSQRLGDLGRYLWIHPNFMINRYGPWMDTNLVQPVDERSCRVIFDYFYAGELGDVEKSEALEQSAQVQAEDTEIVLRVQEGLESGVYSGLYASRFETSMHQFHRMLASDFRAFVGEETGL